MAMMEKSLVGKRATEDFEVRCISGMEYTGTERKR